MAPPVLRAQLDRLARPGLALQGLRVPLDRRDLQELQVQELQGLRVPQGLRVLLARLALLVRKDLRDRQEGTVRLVRRDGQVLLEYRVRRDPPGILGLLDLPVLPVVQEQRALRGRLVQQVREARQARLEMMAELARLGLQVL
jgi:hypothetical protein